MTEQRYAPEEQPRAEGHPRDPLYHSSYIKERLQEIADHLREDVGQVGDQQAKCLFETSAEVLLGLKRAFEHYEQRSEEAWQPREREEAYRRY